MPHPEKAANEFSLSVLFPQRTHVRFQVGDPVVSGSAETATTATSDQVAGLSGRAEGRHYAQLRALRREHRQAHAASAGTGTDP